MKRPRVYEENGVRFIKKCRFGCDLKEECDDVIVETEEVGDVPISSRLVCARDEKMCDRDSEEGRNYDWILKSE